MISLSFGITLSNFLASMSRCPETFWRYRRPNRILVKKYLLSLRPRLLTRRREKASRGLFTRKQQGNQLRHPSRHRPRLPERHRPPTYRLVLLCRYPRLLKHLRPFV